MRGFLTSAALSGLASCGGAMPDDVFSSVIDPVETEVTRGTGPPDADPDACYGRQTTPATVETVTEQVMIDPPGSASQGALRGRGVFETVTRQRIVEERRELWFETPCAADTDPAFIAALQRALGVRGLYRGAPTGRMDRRTRAAIRAFQAPQGLDSAILSLAAARQLGLAVWDPELAAIGSGSP